MPTDADWLGSSVQIDHSTPKLLLEPEKPLLELRAIGTKVNNEPLKLPVSLLIFYEQWLLHDYLILCDIPFIL